MVLDVNKVQQIANYVDQKRNGGNANGYVDGSEVSVFMKKVKTEDRSYDADKINSILNGYKNDKVTTEAQYDKNNTQASTVDEAIIAAFTPDSALNRNEVSAKQGSTIAESLEEADGQSHWYNPFSWWNNNEEVLDYSKLINKDNVLEVTKDQEAVAKIVDSEDEIRVQAGTQIIDALVEAAAERKIDVSNIVIKTSEGYIVGRDVKDGSKNVEFASDALDEDNFEAVVACLRAEISKGQTTAVDASKDADATLTMLASRIDADANNGGNNNGYIDTADEIKAFKQAAAQHNFDINTVLEEIRDNEKDGIENTTNLQKTVANVFDPTRKAESDRKLANEAKDVAKAYADGIENDNEELIQKATKNVNSQNIVEVLNQNPDLVDDLVDEYKSFFGTIFGTNRYAQYTTPILEAAIKCAKENGINIDDIVMVSGDKYIVGSSVRGSKAGEDATDSDNVANVVNAIKSRLNNRI